MGELTWSHTENFLKVSADAHLLVQLRRLGQVGAGFEVRHGEDICPTFTGSWQKTQTTFRQDMGVLSGVEGIKRPLFTP